MSLDDFEQWINEALEALPEPFASRLDNLEIMVAEHPSAAQIQAIGHGNLYGLYQGIPQTRRTSTGYGAVEPDRITLFRHPLTRDYVERAALERQVKHTLFHELAHHFGIDDERLIELGAY